MGAHKIERTWLQCQANFKHFNIPEPVTSAEYFNTLLRTEGWEERYPIFAGLHLDKPDTLGIYCTYILVKYKPVKKMLISFGILLQAQFIVFNLCGFSSTFNQMCSLT
jgi:hypothetical protein